MEVANTFWERRDGLAAKKSLLSLREQLHREVTLNYQRYKFARPLVLCGNLKS